LLSEQQLFPSQSTASVLEEIQQKLPGTIDLFEPDHPSMHATDTVDFNVIVSGEVNLELDDGTEILLKAGDSHHYSLPSAQGISDWDTNSRAAFLSSSPHPRE
jgi:hypothetical protein